MFGDIVDGKMLMNEYGRIAENEILDISQRNNNVKIDDFIIMPNHIHMIISIVGVPPTTTINTPYLTIGNIVRGYKSGVSRKTGISIWQRNYHDHIIRNEKYYEKIVHYIKNNPVRWELDCHNPNNKKYTEWTPS